MLLDLTTAIGSPFDIRKATVTESIASPFTVDLYCVAEPYNLDLEGVVGQPAVFRASQGHSLVGTSARTWGGYVSTIEQVHAMMTSRDGTKPLSTYFLRIVPQIWLLTQRTNYRIYQRLSIPDILDKLLGEWHIEPVWKIDRGDYPKLEYKSQYGETDFAFFSRLLV